MRAYEPGDDVRRIEWNVTARTGQPHVRVELAERVLVTWLVLDASASMAFGTAERRKADVAEGVAIAVGYAATRRGNRLGTISFGDDGRRSSRRARDGGRCSTRCSCCATLPADGTGSLRDALELADRSSRQRALVVLVSDFRGPPDWRAPLLRLAGRHTVLAVEIRDPREQELADVGELRLVDPETGRQLRVDTSDRRLRERFAAAAASERRGARRGARLGRRAARRALDRGRLAAAARRVPAPEGARRMSFAVRLLLLVPAGGPGRRGRPLAARSASSAPARGRTWAPAALLPNMIDAAAEPAPAPADGARARSASRCSSSASLARRRRYHVKAQEATLVLVLDVSGSMAANDCAPTRFAAAKAIAHRFLAKVPHGYRVALVTFSDHVAVAAAPTHNLAAVSGCARARTHRSAGNGARRRGRPRRARRGGRARLRWQGTVRPPRSSCCLGRRPDRRARDTATGRSARAAGGDPRLDDPRRHPGRRRPAEAARAGSPSGSRCRPSRRCSRHLARRSDGRFTGGPAAVDVAGTYDELGSRTGKRKKTVEVTAAAAGGGLAFVLAGGLLSGLWFRRIP